VLISNHIQKNEIYGTATPIPSANAAALDADGILLTSSEAEANAAAAKIGAGKKKPFGAAKGSPFKLGKIGKGAAKGKPFGKK